MIRNVGWSKKLRAVSIGRVSICGQAECVDQVCAEYVCITNSKRLDHVAVAGSAYVQNVLIERVRGRLAEKAVHIPPEQRMLVAALIIDFPDGLSFIVDSFQAVSDQPARIDPIWGDNLAMFRACLLNSAGSIRLLTNGALKVICRPLLQVGEAKAVKSPASIAGVGTKACASAGSRRTVVS